MNEINIFNDYMLNRGKSKITVKNTVKNTNEFLKIMNINTLNDVQKLKPLDIESYLSTIRERGNCDNSRKTKVAQVRMFFNFLYDNELINKNIMKGQKIKCGIPEIIDFSYNDVIKVLNNTKSIREYIILHTLLGTGIRISELLTLRCDKVFDGYIQVLGKGDKWRNVQCPTKVTDTLKQFITKTAMDRGSSPLVLITKSGKPLDKSNVTKSLKRVAKRANIKDYEHFSAHKIRHTYARYALNSLKIPLDVVSKNLGHSSVAITSQVYAKTDNSRVKEYISNVPETFLGEEYNFER